MKGQRALRPFAADACRFSPLLCAIDIGSRQSGNIGYIVGNQALKWQHLWQQGGNNRQHFGMRIEHGLDLPHAIRVPSLLCLLLNLFFARIAFSGFLLGIRQNFGVVETYGISLPSAKLPGCLTDKHRLAPHK